MLRWKTLYQTFFHLILFPLGSRLPWDFAFSHINCITIVKWLCVAPLLHICVVAFFWSFGIMHCMFFTFEKEFRSCARWSQRSDIFHFHWWTASMRPRLLFSPWKLCFLGKFPVSQIICILFYNKNSVPLRREVVYVISSVWIFNLTDWFPYCLRNVVSHVIAI